VVAAVTLVTASCYRAPAIAGPRRGALEATTVRSVAEATHAALGAITDEGLSVEQFRPDTGLVETRWFDVAALETGAATFAYPAQERLVRFRFLAVADPAAGATRLYLEPLRPSVTDRMGGRRSEQLVPRDHPAMAVGRRVLDRIHDRLEP
jgi:hypothetical protein